MASGISGVTAQSVLGKISRDHLECPICSNRFKEPKLLDCLHSFCLECLQEIRRRQSPQDAKLACPLCRRETVPKGDISDLPHNFAMSALVEEVNVQEQLLEGQESKIKCQACEDQNKAISRCMDCDHFLCLECQWAHARMKMMKTHTTYTLAQLQSGEVTYKSKLREHTPKCNQHPDQTLAIYCSKCEELVCTTCAILDHEKHVRIGLPQALGKCKQDIKEMSAKAERNKLELSMCISDVDKTHKKLDNMYADTNNKISRKADKEVAKITKDIERIREKEQKLKQEADAIYKDRVKTLGDTRALNSRNLTLTDHKLGEVNHFMAQASSYEILDFKQKLLHNLNELTGRRSEKVSYNLSFMDFEEGDERSLGTLVLQGKQKMSHVMAVESKKPVKWELKTEIKTFGQQQTTFRQVDEVAALSSNEIVVLDDKHKQFITFLLDKCPSTVLSRDLQLKGLSNPTHVSVNKAKQLIVLDPPAVKIFNRGYQSCLHQFKPGSDSQGKPSCLAVNDSNLIAVGYEDAEKISLHKPDGSLIRKIPAPLIGGNLTTYKQRFIYTVFVHGRKKLQSVDSNGGTVFSVDITSNIYGLWSPNGLCCDSQGSIYVAVYGRQQGEIQHFSPNGEYIECAVKNCGPPGDVTITPSDDLVVAATHSVQIYHRV